MTSSGKIDVAIVDSSVIRSSHIAGLDKYWEDIAVTLFVPALALRDPRELTNEAALGPNARNILSDAGIQQLPGEGSLDELKSKVAQGGVPRRIYSRLSDVDWEGVLCAQDKKADLVTDDKPQLLVSQAVEVRTVDREEWLERVMRVAQPQDIVLAFKRLGEHPHEGKDREGKEHATTWYNLPRPQKVLAIAEADVERNRQSGHLPQFGDAPVKDAKTVPAPKPKRPDSVDNQELKEALEGSGVSPKDSGYKYQ